MSKFLGKIHYWLYNKVKWHEELEKDLLRFVNSKGFSTMELEKEIDNLYGQTDSRKLEEIIDHSNIHGWLQNKIARIEIRIAYIITYLINKDKITIDQLKKIYSDNGARAYMAVRDNIPEVSPEQLYKIIFDFLIEGMPCDRVNEIVRISNIEITWKSIMCVHKKYWDEVHGNESVFYTLRDSWIEGFINLVDNYKFNKVSNGLISITKEV